jgi:hypothetical protein
MREIGAIKWVVIFATVAEAVRGLALLMVPSLAGQPLFSQQLDGVAIAVARVTEIGLIGLGISCWPATPLVGMFTYSSAVTLYLAYVGRAFVARGCVARHSVDPSRSCSVRC